MSLVVPFDGSTLAKAALVRAVQFETVLEEDLLVVSVIPQNNTQYAREQGWIDRTEPYDTETVLSHLRSEVARLAPGASFHPISVDRHAPRGTIAGRIRRFARENDASIVFIGSENAGRIVSSITVGQSVAGDRFYDTFIVTSAQLPEIEKLEAAVPTEELLS